MAKNECTDIEAWADDELSSDLPIIRARGESQEMEFMSEFPSNTRELAKEVAAFATSNTGTILIGVSDEGDIVGVSDAQTVKGRDTLLKRLGGICAGTVKPAITPKAKFAVEDDRVVLVITVPKGLQPVYYCVNTPYLRHLTESRPAEPNEVYELVSAHVRETAVASGDPIDEASDQIYSDLARILVDILVIGDEVDVRQFNPWLDMWRSEFDYYASELRAMASETVAQKETIDGELFELANALDNVANLRLHMGIGAELTNLTSVAVENAQHLMSKYIEPATIAPESIAHVQSVLIVESRKLVDLVSRSTEMANGGRLEELQTEVSDIGRNIARIGYYNVFSTHEKLGTKLKSIGRKLHLIETMQVYMDGGESVRKILEQISESQNDLTTCLDLADRDMSEN